MTQCKIRFIDLPVDKKSYGTERYLKWDITYRMKNLNLLQKKY